MDSLAYNFLILGLIKEKNSSLSKKKPTIVDIANALGISPSAVSKAFNDHPRMSQQTKKDVARVAKEMGYQRNSMAKGLRNGRSGLIGVMVPQVNLSFFSTAIKGMEDTLFEAGYQILIGQSKDDEEKEKIQVDAFLNAQVEGIIASIASTTKDSSHFQKALDLGTKVILFDRTFKNFEVSKVIIDDYIGGYLGAEHLISQGYKRIGLISGPKGLLPYKRRKEGYEDALLAKGLVVDETIIRVCEIGIENGKKKTLDLLTSQNPPDAIFCLSDLLALGASQAIGLKGFSIPKDIGLVGFSNEDFTTYVSPSITSIEQYSEQLGQIAAKSLLEQLVSTDHIPKHIFLPQTQVLTPKLIIRQSSIREPKTNNKSLEWL